MTTKAKLILYTASTPNGYKVSIALEELKAIGAPIEYETKAISFGQVEQKSEWFLKINPNGRIPALTDVTNNNLNVWESASIVLYLAKHYDTNKVFTFDTPEEEADMYSWIFFGHGGLGPMQGQSNHFTRYAPEKIPYAITRYQTETKRLYATYDKHLAERDWLVGKGKGKFSVVEMLTWPWVRGHAWAGIETLDEFPNLKAWVARTAERPAVQDGLKVPEDLSKVKIDPAAKAKEASDWILKGMGQQK